MIDWIAVSAGATALMAIATCISIIQNHKLWRDTKRPYIYISVFISQLCKVPFYCLKIKNHGKSVANEIKITICDDFIKRINIKKIKDYCYEINRGKSILPPTDEQCFYLFPELPTGVYSYDYYKTNYKDYSNFIDEIKKVPLTINCQYNGRYKEKTVIYLNNILEKATNIAEVLNNTNEILGTIANSIKES
ncbi:MAG: hypothetical protein LKK19_01880 [Bacteroidales bacterium]|jgi:hypothetical protein|nr:hypothetical protein [Bacteroidales bacterium]MCI2145860.1 hypothetical protein [Bacteroidales bacterium]